MTTEINNTNKFQHDLFQEASNCASQIPDLEQIILNSYDAIFVTDKTGKVLLVNPSTSRILGVEEKNLVGKNVKELVQAGIYDWSPSLKAIETRSVVTGVLKSGHGGNVLATSTPLLDESGEIIMVVTNTTDKNVLDKYVEAIENERLKAERYKNAVDYLCEVESEQNIVVAESKQMREIIVAANVIAKTDSTVMLIGESGTGKEVMARYIHRNSNRSQEPFIPVNCAAIPSELLESEFFGYVKGAFTGASNQGKPGLFEIAHNGTLFLDEIGELPLAMQSKLLRVLETGEIQRVGSTTIFHTDIRLVTATNRDLKAMIKQKLFRSDLYYRLNVIPLYLPPLRERPEDIYILANRFLEELNKKYALKKHFTTDTVKAFLNYNWPGNVRELRNVIERLVITSTEDNLRFNIDSVNYNQSNTMMSDSIPEKSFVGQGTLKSFLKTLEEQYINQVMAECGGRVSEAAKRLGIHRSRLYRKIETINKDK